MSHSDKNVPNQAVSTKLTLILPTARNGALLGAIAEDWCSRSLCCLSHYQKNYILTLTSCPQCSFYKISKLHESLPVGGILEGTRVGRGRCWILRPTCAFASQNRLPFNHYLLITLERENITAIHPVVVRCTFCTTNWFKSIRTLFTSISLETFNTVTSGGCPGLFTGGGIETKLCLLRASVVICNHFMTLQCSKDVIHMIF